jgi:threonine synthase
MRCRGCGWTVPREGRPFRCANAGRDDADHVLVRNVDARAAREAFFDDEPNPFLRYRRLTYAWHDAAARGIGDEAFVDAVQRLTDAVAAVDGRRFAVTPFERRSAVYVKDETGNVAGSHKGRHLFGVMIWLELMSRFDAELAAAPLAIASCGNAAFAAATIARAARRRLEVFVPGEAAAEVVARIEALGARVTRCERTGGMAGDPSVMRFREAVARGALPFTCQGTENGLTIEGGSTLGWELASAGVPMDRLFLQVGGGALASAVIAGLQDAVAAGVLERLPRIHAVQTEGSPLARAWQRLEGRPLEEAIRNRSQFMQPRETAAVSVATGILDDETYDWIAIVEGMRASGGWPVVVSEEQLAEAQRLSGGSLSVDTERDDEGASGGPARPAALLSGQNRGPGEQPALPAVPARRRPPGRSSLGPSATGAAGLAGVLALPGDGATAVLFTG